MILNHRWQLIYLFLVTAGLHLAFSSWAYDDPFITYRYAENIAAGQGMVYNTGQPVLSTTTPLFALLLAVLKSVWPILPQLANEIGFLSLGVGALFIWDIGQSQKSPAAGWAALLLYPTFTLLLTTTGSETPLYLALGLGSFAYYARGKLSTAAVFAALATLTRPDGVLIPVIWGVDYFLKNFFNTKEHEGFNGEEIGNSLQPLWLKREFWQQRLKPEIVNGFIPWRAVAVFIGLLIPWAVFAWLYFGSPLPVTLAAKQQQALLQNSLSFAAGLGQLFQDYGQAPNNLIAAGLAVFGFGNALIRRKGWLPLLIWPVVYAAGYAVLDVTAYFWYFAPLVPAFIAAVGLGLDGIWQFGAGENRLSISTRGVAVAALALLTILQVRDLSEARLLADTRADIYQAAGEWLAENTPENASVGSLEIGIIGYYAQREMVDFAGLLQPDTAQQFGEVANYQGAALWAVERYQPEYLALRQNDVPRLQRVYAAESCVLLQKFLGADYGHEQDLIIYDCRKAK